MQKKQERLFLLIVLVSSLFSLSVYGAPVSFKGHWKGKGIRSLTFTPTPPIAFIDDNVLTLSFVDTITDLTVTVTDENGMVVYQAIMSEEAGSTYLMPLDVSPGTYELTLIHSRHGSLSGVFDVE